MFNKEFRYTLEKSSCKHICPECGKKTFVRYIDTQRGNYLPEQYGRCDREQSCSYHLNPYKDGYAMEIRQPKQGNQTSQKPKRTNKPLAQTPQTAFIPFEIFAPTRAGYEYNTFIQNLLTRVAFPFEEQDVEKVITLYHLGTIQDGYRKGAVTFPYIDKQGNIRAVQAVDYDKNNHRQGVSYLHSLLSHFNALNGIPNPDWLTDYLNNEKVVSCLFGEHLLKKYPNNPVALVESPKTAIVAALYFGFPEPPTNILWLAVYNLSSLTLDKCKALSGRKVYLFPDLSKDGKAFELWSKKATQIQRQLQGTYIHVSDLLEHLAPQQDKEQGKDLADYLITQNWRLFRKQDKQEAPQPQPLAPAGEKSEKSEALKKTFFSQPQPLALEPIPSPNKWANEINELESFFNSIVFPSEPTQLTQMKVINYHSFVKQHIGCVRANNGDAYCSGYLNRLQELKKLLA